MIVTTCAPGAELRAHRYAVFPVQVPNSNNIVARRASVARTHASASDVPPGTSSDPRPMNFATGS